MALGDDVVLVNGLQVLLAGRYEARVVQLRKGANDAGNHLAHAVLDETGTTVGLLHDLHLVGALHQLVDLRRHAGLGDRQQRGRVDLRHALLDASDLQRGQAALVVGGHGHPSQDPLDLVGGEAVGDQVLTCAGRDQLLGAGTGRDAGG